VSVGVAGGEIEAGAHRAGGGPLGVALAVTDVAGADGLREEHLHGGTDQGVGVVAEEVLGAAISRHNAAVRANDEDPIGRGVADLAKEVWVQAPAPSGV
jgi:hypothetical protein